MPRTQHRIDAICDFTQNILAVRATITRELLQKRKQIIKRDIIPEIKLNITWVQAKKIGSHRSCFMIDSLDPRKNELLLP